jgi:hypothetical protein
LFRKGSRWGLRLYKEDREVGHPFKERCEWLPLLKGSTGTLLQRDRPLNGNWVPLLNPMMGRLMPNMGKKKKSKG